MKAWIEKISLEGLKSYGKDRVEIPLGQGFIGIVGPNGKFLYELKKKEKEAKN